MRGTLGVLLWTLGEPLVLLQKSERVYVYTSKKYFPHAGACVCVERDLSLNKVMVAVLLGVLWIIYPLR